MNWFAICRSNAGKRSEQSGGDVTRWSTSSWDARSGQSYRAEDRSCFTRGVCFIDRYVNISFHELMINDIDVIKWLHAYIYKYIWSAAAVATFCRFFPKMRARYDYGVLIFILTFSLISVSGYRDDVVLDMAHRRLSTVLIGGFATVLVCILVRPVWAGEDLHKLTASNIDKLGCFLEGRHIFQQLIINYIFDLCIYMWSNP